MKFISSLLLCIFFTSNLFAQFQNQRIPTGQPNTRPGTQSTQNFPKFVKGEYIVKLKSGASVQSLNSSQNGKLSQIIKVGKSNFAIMKSNFSLEQLRNSLDNSTIDYIEPNFIYYTQGFQTSKNFSADEISSIQSEKLNSYIPADEFFTKLWGLHNESALNRLNARGADIDAIEAWKITTGDKKVVIAVIDTGIDYNHPDIKPNMWINTAEANGQADVDDDGNGIIDDIHGAAFVSGKTTGNPLDDHSHGTHCAGTIAAAHNEQGVAGVMANVRLMGVKFLSKSGSGTTADAIKAINYATQMGANAMSNSWGGGAYSKALEDAIKEANAKGIVFIAAAGNSKSNNDTNPSYPASYPVENIISVAAHDINDKLATFSSYGAKSVHVAAPGVDILSTVLSGKYATYSGTSMATPHVSGVIGLMLSKMNTTARSKSLALIKESLVKTATAAPAYNGKVSSGGRVSSAKAITSVMNGFRNGVSRRE
jgi:thermitase